MHSNALMVSQESNGFCSVLCLVVHIIKVKVQNEEEENMKHVSVKCYDLIHSGLKSRGPLCVWCLVVYMVLSTVLLGCIVLSMMVFGVWCLVFGCCWDACDAIYITMPCCTNRPQIMISKDLKQTWTTLGILGY